MSARKVIQFQDTIGKLYPDFYEHVTPKDASDMATKNVTFQVTDACNLRCTYCYQINKHTNVMPFEVAKDFIELLLEKGNDKTAEYYDTWNSKAVIIEFIGGEPFLQIDLVDQITDYFIKRMIETDHPWQYHYMISICSNGLLYFDPKVQAYLKKHLHHLSFSISIDGNKKLHDACRVLPDGSGSYDIAMKGVRHFIDVLGGTMGSKMTIAPNNVMYTAEAIQSIIENGYTDINLNCVFEEGWTEEHAKIFYEQLKIAGDYILDHDLEDDVSLSIFEEGFFRPKALDDTKNWCGGNGQMISVDYKGDIYPCIRYMESSLGDDKEPIIVGNVKEGFFVTEHQHDCFKCLKATTRISESTQECIECPIAEGCSECLAYNYQKYGLPIKRATFICIMHKARCLANAYYFNKQFKKHNSNKRFKIWLPDTEALKIISQEELDMLHYMETHL